MALAPVSFPVLEQGLKQQQQRCLFFIDTRFDDSMHSADAEGPFCEGFDEKLKQFVNIIIWF